MAGTERPKWRRSMHCDSSACVEVAMAHDGAIAVRDGKDPDGPQLTFAHDEWMSFMTWLRRNVA